MDTSTIQLPVQIRHEEDYSDSSDSEFEEHEQAHVTEKPVRIVTSESWVRFDMHNEMIRNNLLDERAPSHLCSIGNTPIIQHRTRARGLPLPVEHHKYEMKNGSVVEGTVKDVWVVYV